MVKYYILSLFVVGALLTACSNENENYANGQRLPQNELETYRTILELQAFNSQFISEHPFTRSNWWNNLQIARADYTWGKRGVKAGQVIAGLAGAATGGTGYAITVGVSAGVVGGYASYRKWQQLYPNKDGASVGYNDALDKMENLYERRYYNDILNSLGIDNYASLGAQINLPANFEHLRRIGNDHNKVLVELSNTFQSGLRRSPIEEADDPGFILSPIAELFNAEELLLTSCTLYTAITPTSDGDSSASVSQVIDSVIDSFDSLVSSSSITNAELISAINSYISIIENNNELSFSEKETVYSTLVIALYSILYWNDNL